MSGFHSEFKLDLPANRYKMPTKSRARGHRMNTTGLLLQQLSPEKTRHIKNPMLGSRSMRKRGLGVLGEAEGAEMNFSMLQCLGAWSPHVVPEGQDAAVPSRCHPARYSRGAYLSFVFSSKQVR